MGDADDETAEGGSGGGGRASGPNALCFTCGGFRKISEPKVYVIQATAEMRAGMSVGQWRDCPHCGGSGQLNGLDAPA